SSTMQTWLFTLCTSMPILSIFGLPLLAALTARLDSGAFQLPRWSGGQPLHPIYPHRPAIDASVRVGTLVSKTRGSVGHSAARQVASSTQVTTSESEARRVRNRFAG